MKNKAFDKVCFNGPSIFGATQRQSYDLLRREIRRISRLHRRWKNGKDFPPGNPEQLIIGHIIVSSFIPCLIFYILLFHNLKTLEFQIPPYLYPSDHKPSPSLSVKHLL